MIHLAALFNNMITFPAPSVTPERELAYLSLVSADAEERDERLRKQQDPASSSAPAKENPPTENSTGSAETDATLVDPATQLVEATDEGQQAAKAPVLLERRASLMHVGAQQDVSECLDNIMFQLEVALGALEADAQGATSAASSGKEGSSVALAAGEAPPSGAAETSSTVDETQLNLLDSLFLGQTAQRLLRLDATGSQATPQKKGEDEVKKEVFKVLPVNVLDEEGRDIYDGLDSFFDEEVIDGRKRSVTLLRLPPVLQVQLQRAQFDRARGRLWKAQAHVETPEIIYLDRYCDFEDFPTSPEEAARVEKRQAARSFRQEASQLQARAAFLRSGSAGGSASPAAAQPLVKTLLDTAELLQAVKMQQQNTEGEAAATWNRIEVEEGLDAELKAHAQQVGEELKRVEERLKEVKVQTNALWEDEKRHAYMLVSLFMHRGEATHGHYFLNQKKLPADEAAGGGKDVWFKYNDSVVTKADAKDVLRDPTSANPYLVCYVRKDLQEKLGLVETLKRQF